MHYLRLLKVANVRKCAKFKVDGIGFKKIDMVSANLLRLPKSMILLDFVKNIFCVDKAGSGLCFADMEDHFMLYDFSNLVQYQKKLMDGNITGEFSIGVRKYNKKMKLISTDGKPGVELKNMMLQGLMITAGICKNMNEFKKRESNYYGGKVHIFNAKRDLIPTEEEADADL